MSIKTRIDKAEAHRAEKPHGDGIVIVYDAEHAARHPEKWEAFKAAAYERFPGIKTSPMFSFEPRQPGWMQHWPHPEGDAAALDLFDQQDALEAFLDVTEYLSPEGQSAAVDSSQTTVNL